MKITKVDNDNASKTAISFTGVSHGSGGIEFFNLTKNKDFEVIFVEDTNSTWYNSINSKKIINSICKNKEVITIGNSMGAFNATMFARDYPVHKVIAFATQYSIHPDIVPWEKRWLSYANHIKHWKVKHLEFNNSTRYHFISGDDEKELAHLNMIPNNGNINKTIIKNCGHNVSKSLKLNNELYKIINIILDE